MTVEHGKPGPGQRTIFDTGEIDTSFLDDQPDPGRAYTQGHVYERSGRASGRLSDHSGPIPRPDILRGLTDYEIDVQYAINADGANQAHQVMAGWHAHNDDPLIGAKYIDPATGHAILGAAASEYDGGTVQSVLPETPETTWAQDYVAQIKASMTFPHSGGRKHHI